MVMPNPHTQMYGTMIRGSSQGTSIGNFMGMYRLVHGNAESLYTNVRDDDKRIPSGNVNRKSYENV